MSGELSLSDYLERIRQEAVEACGFVEGIRRIDFLDNKLKQKGVIMSIIAIGETVAQIEKYYSEFIANHPEIQWRKIRDTRNRVAHGYFELNFDRIWDLAQTGMPELIALLGAISMEG